MLVVFDLDGTLVDSGLDLALSTNEMLGTYGAPALPVGDVVMMVGEGALVLVRRALAAAGIETDEAEALRRFREIYDRRLLETTRPYPGIADMLAAAATRAALAVLTNKPEAPTRRLLDGLGLTTYFRDVVGGDGAWARKPDPAGLQALIARAGAVPRSTLFVGDSRIDVETARRAGVALCVARYGFGWAQGGIALAPTDVVADTAAAVAEAIAAFLSSAHS
jgi:phosphoglycolate phosphatase